MGNIICVEHIDIPELDLYVGNKEVHLLRFYEPEPGIFIAESRNVIEIALKKGFEPLSVVCTRRFIGDEILDRMGDIPIYVVDPEKAKKHFGYVLTGGILAAMRRKPNPKLSEVIGGARRIVVLEDVENPTNVGAVFRSAAAFGFDGVVLSPSSVDPFYRRAMRVSVGNALNIPWTFFGRNRREWEETGVESLKEAGFLTVALALRKDNVCIDDPCLKTADKVALFLGNEGKGLLDQTIDKCDKVARIPMMNGVDSLNVSVAAALAMWELREKKVE